MSPAAGVRLPDLSVRVVSAIVLAFLAARLLAGAFANILPDETYYWLWSRYPAASYYDHPPMVAWWMWLSTALFGNSPFGVRALSIASIVPLSWAVWLTARELFDRTVAAWSVVFLNATLLIGIGGMIATPDAPSVLFWALATVAFVLAVRSSQPLWWLVVGLCAGLGVLSKLTNLFFGVGVVLALLAHPRLRRWLATPWPWAGGAVAVLVVLPMVLWNAGHDWITFSHQFRRLPASSFQPYYLGEFLVSQFFLLNPLVTVLLGFAVAGWLRMRRRPRGGFALLFWTVLPMFAFMAFHGLYSTVEGNWLAPIYPTLAILAATAVPAAGPRLQWVVRAVLPVGAVASAIGLAVFAMPDGVLPRQADFGRLARGWPALAAEIERVRAEIGAAWIATVHYAANGELAYQLRGTGTPVVQVTDRARYAFAPPPDDSLLGKPALIVLSGPVPPELLARCFATVTPVATANRSTFQRFGLYRGEGASPRLFADGC